MKTSLSPAVFLTILAIALSACSSSAGQTPEAAPAVGPVPGATGTLPRLVFFMNPGGAPCQMQDRVLREMSPELNGKLEVVYYRTTNPYDLAMFDRFGIRSLPALVLTDAAGNEIRRATPGVQSPEAVRHLLLGQ